MSSGPTQQKCFDQPQLMLQPVASRNQATQVDITSAPLSVRTLSYETRNLYDVRTSVDMRRELVVGYKSKRVAMYPGRRTRNEHGCWSMVDARSQARGIP